MSKPVDPATRLSDLLAQSLEELTRPFDPPRPGPVRVEPRLDTPRSEAPRAEPGSVETHDAAAELAPPPAPEDARIDADRALAELEAELFAAAKEVDRQGATAEPEGDHPVDLDAADKPVVTDEKLEKTEHSEPEHAVDAPALSVVPAAEPEKVEPAADADAERLVARVRRLMMVSMAITVIAVGSIFAFIGYRISKGDGVSEKRADKLPATSPIPTDVTLALPRGARVVQSSVAGDRLVITLEIDGKLEVRTFDVTTLQPAGRLNFSATP